MSPKTRFTYLSIVFCLIVFPSAATLVAQIDPVGEVVLNPPAGSFIGVAEKDGYVYASTTWGQFCVFDIRSLSVDGPFRTFSTPLVRQEYGNEGLLRHGNTLYVYGPGIQVFDITNPASPVAGVFLDGYDLQNLCVSGDYLFGTGSDTVVVYSVSDPAHPTLRAAATLDGRKGFAIAYRDQHVYVGEFKSPYYGLRVLSFDGANTLTSVYQQTLSGVPYHLLVSGSYLADTGNGARVWSLADPARPAVVAEQVASGRAAFQWGNLLVTNGRVHTWHGPVLEEYSRYTAGSNQHDGLPHGAAGNSRFIFIGQQARILILSTPPTLVFPQYANGASGGALNRTRLILRNSGPAATSGVVRFLDTDGALRLLPIGGTGRSEVDYSIPAGGTFELVTDGTGDLRFGPLEVRSDVPGDSALRGTEIFDLLGHNASVQSAPLSKTHSVFVTRSTLEKSGFAIFNPSLTTVSGFQAELFSNVGILVAGPTPVNLQPRQQLSIFVDDTALFRTYFLGITGGFQGTMKLSWVSGGPVAVTSLIQKTGDNSLLVLPVESEILGP